MNTYDLLALLAAIPLAALGGEAFLKGVLGIAASLRLPKLLVASTLAAFATSSPELTVSSMAALAGRPEIGLGDALGSNVVNIGLILGLTLLFGALTAPFSEIKRKFYFALAAPFFTLVLVLDGSLSRADGAFMLALFALWLAITVQKAIQHRREITNNEALIGISVQPARACLLLIAGLASLIMAGRLFVTGASGVAEALNINAYLVGVTVVAIGTSLPELVTTLLARWHGHDDVGLGTLLGSNLFNGLAIVGIAAAIHPIRAPASEVAVALGFGVLMVLLILPRANVISRQRGLIMLAAYAAFLTTTLGF